MLAGAPGLTTTRRAATAQPVRIELQPPPRTRTQPDPGYVAARLAAVSARLAREYDRLSVGTTTPWPGPDAWSATRPRSEDARGKCCAPPPDLARERARAAPPGCVHGPGGTMPRPEAPRRRHGRWGPASFPTPRRRPTQPTRRRVRRGAATRRGRGNGVNQDGATIGALAAVLTDG